MDNTTVVHGKTGMGIGEHIPGRQRPLGLALQDTTAVADLHALFPVTAGRHLRWEKRRRIQWRRGHEYPIAKNRPFLLPYRLGKSCTLQMSGLRGGEIRTPRDYP